MVHSGYGIVLGFLKYGDTSVIARILTKDHGLTSFLIQGVFRKKARISASMLQPFSLLEMIYYYKENRQIHKIKEAKANPPLNAIQLDVVKSGVAIFICELLQNVLKNTEQDHELFNMIETNIIGLNTNEKISPFWAHSFLIELATTIGFSPSLQSTGRFFHLREGVFTNIPLADSEITSAEETEMLLKLLNREQPLGYSKTTRSALLDKLVAYFSYHVGGFKELKTLDVLRNVMA